MRILVDINHPAHVHLFRNAIWEWEKRGYQVKISARAKDVSIKLLDLYGFEYCITASQRKGEFVRGVLELDWAVWNIARKFNPDWMVGTSFAIAHISKLINGRSIVFGEDDVKSSTMFWRITQPFADYIVTPDTIPDNFGKKHIRYAGNQELAYLHPSRFTPNPEILKELGISSKERYFLLRFVSLQASHDRGEQGLSLSTKRKLIETLSNHGRVFISAEGDVPSEFKHHQIDISPEKIHDVLAFAGLVIADSQSMVVEAAVLGVPSLRCNTFVGKTPVVDHLEHRYELTYGFLPHQESALFSKMEILLRDKEVKEKWAKRRNKLLAESIDLTSYMVNLIEELHSKEKIR